MSYSLEWGAEHGLGDVVGYTKLTKEDKMAAKKSHKAFMDAVKKEFGC